MDKNMTSSEINTPKSTFYTAFSPGIGCYHAHCACGREFVSGNEPEANEASENATYVDTSLAYIEFEGVTYVYLCNCWWERANRIQQFIDGHFEQITSYINGEIKRKREEAYAFTEISS